MQGFDGSHRCCRNSCEPMVLLASIFPLSLYPQAHQHDFISALYSFAWEKSFLVPTAASLHPSKTKLIEHNHSHCPPSWEANAGTWSLRAAIYWFVILAWISWI
jgi:hypothetical protein